MDYPEAVGDFGANRPPGNAALPAIDADRERAASLLQAATADGRLSLGEMEKRLNLIHAARSRGEVAAITNDLRPSRLTTAAPTTTKDSRWLTSFARRGRWVVGDRYRGTSFLGSGVVDLREALFTGPEATVRIDAWLSTVYVVVPDDVDVVLSGSGLIGGFVQDRDGDGHPASVRVTVTGVAVCGTVHVVHQLPPDRERRLPEGDQ